MDSAFLIHVGTRQIPMYIEKKHYHVGKKDADVGFEWQILYFNPMIFLLEHQCFVENTVEHIHFEGHRQEISALY